MSLTISKLAHGGDGVAGDGTRDTSSMEIKEKGRRHHRQARRASGPPLAERFTRAGRARAVVIADQDEERTRATADAIGATAVQADGERGRRRRAADRDRRGRRHGPIDLFCANAGIGRGTGLDSPDESGDAVLDVTHAGAHRRRAARSCRCGSSAAACYWLTTASAAGIVTQIGDAPYAVSQARGRSRSPSGSASPTAGAASRCRACARWESTPRCMREGAGAAAATRRSGARRVVEAAGTILQPEDTSRRWSSRASPRRTFLILPHPEVLDYFRRKAADYDPLARRNAAAAGSRGGQPCA